MSNNLSFKSAQEDDISYIALQLVGYFEKINKSMNVDYYKTSLDIFTKNISERILHPDGINYYRILQDEHGRKVGFINYAVYLKKKSADIQIIWAENNDVSCIQYMIEALKEELKNKDVKHVIFEISSDEEILSQVVQSLSSQKMTETYIYNI
jgi:hypothetical protein